MRTHFSLVPQSHRGAQRAGFHCPLKDTERARSYIARMPPSVQGRGGSTAFYNVARALVKGFALPEAEALPILAEWNAVNAVPPWSEPEMRHKLKSAAGSYGTLGYLVKSGGGFSSAFSQPRARVPRPAATAGGDESVEDAAVKKERRRAAWPALRPLTQETMRVVANLRGVSLPAVLLLHHSGFLRGAVVDGHRCFIIREGAFAQARRLDGGALTVWRNGEAEEVKAKNLPGSTGAFLGLSWLGAPECPVLLVEGAAGLLEGVSAALSVNADLRHPHGWTVLAAASAGSRFNDSHLSLLRGRRVRIVPDNDAAGREACGKWTASLRAAGCAVDAVFMPDGFKDLGEATRSPDFPAIAEALFTL